MSEDGTDISEHATEEMEKAREALSDASVLRDHGGSRDAIANRLYYACYHAAKAILYSKDLQPKTHAGVVAQFGEHVVKTGEVLRKTGCFSLDHRRDARKRTTSTNRSVRTSMNCSSEPSSSSLI